jgi:hypothetical protein
MANVGLIGDRWSMLDQHEIIVSCPYCGEAIDVLVDSSAGAQEYFEDCSVCCAPILFVVTVNEVGELLTVEPRRDDE